MVVMNFHVVNRGRARAGVLMRLLMVWLLAPANTNPNSGIVYNELVDESNRYACSYWFENRWHYLGHRKLLR